MKISSPQLNNINMAKANPVFFITPNPNRAIGLEKAVKNYFVVCSQKTEIVAYLKKEGVPVLCLNNDEIKNSGKILANEKVIEYIKEKSENKKANIITFKPSPMIHKICAENDFRYLGNDWRLNRKLEDKIEFVKITNELKIPNARSRVVKVSSVAAKATFRNVALGEKYVVQLPRGFSGKTTFLIKNKKDPDNIIKKYLGRKIKLSKFLEGETWTINACIAGNKILMSRPIFQITGLTAYNKNRLGTCGNDYAYGEELDSEGGIGQCRLRNQGDGISQCRFQGEIFDYTKKIGNYLKSLKYKGIFGLDFIASDNEINLIEINPRLVASIPVFTKLQIQNKEKPFLLSHILEFIKDSQISIRDGISEYRSRSETKSNNFNASQLIMRNTKKDPIEIIKSLKSGIYEVKKNKPVFKKEAYCFERRLDENEFLIQCSSKGNVINPDMEYANIQVGYGIMKNKRQFKSSFSKIIKTVLENIKIRARLERQTSRGKV